MSKARLVITAVTIEKRPVGEVARSYGVARSWIYTLLARYAAEGEAAFEPRSRRPRSSPAAIPDSTVELIVRLRKELAGQGLDAGPHTIAWHPGTPPPHPGLRGGHQPLPGPGRAGHPRAAQAPEVLVPEVPGGPAERVLAGRLHPLSPRRRGRHRDPDLAR
jgi:hypothetical protein